MNATPIDGKRLAADLRTAIARGVVALKDRTGVTPGLAVILVGVVQQCFLAPVGVVGESMYPTINPEGDKVFVQKKLYSIDRGDVIVFYRPFPDIELTTENPANRITFADFFNSLPFVNKHPRTEEDATASEYTCVIKRVIGLPGDTVEIRQLTGSGLAQLLVNDKVVNDGFPMSCKSTSYSTGVVPGVWTVEEGKFFVLGDNRNNSYDSEDYGTISQEWLMGKVVAAKIGGKYKFGLGVTIID